VLHRHVRASGKKDSISKPPQFIYEYLTVEWLSMVKAGITSRASRHKLIDPDKGKLTTKPDSRE
jgi:hypothetical protein